MNALETIELIKVLRQSGATHFKSSDFEVSLLASSEVQLPVGPKAQEVPTPANPDATQKIKDLISTIKMSPEQLADQIFPNGAGG